MKESYEKGLANRSASNPTPAMVTSWVWHGQEVHAGQLLSSEITTSACRPCPDRGKATSTAALYGESPTDAAESETLCMRGNSSRENREILFGFHPAEWHVTSGVERSENASGGTC